MAEHSKTPRIIALLVLVIGLGALLMAGLAGQIGQRDTNELAGYPATTPAGDKNSATQGSDMASAKTSEASMAEPAAGQSTGNGAGAAQGDEHPGKQVADPQDVVAKVGNEDITREDVYTYMEQLPARVRHLDPEKVFPLALQQLVDQTVIEHQARQSGIAESEQVEQRLAELKEQVVRNVFLENEIEEAVTEEKLRAAYEEATARQEEVEEVRASHILVESREEAQSIITGLEEGKSFDELAGEYEQSGDLGYFSRKEMVKPFADKAFDIEAGSYTKEPVKTQYGWHVIKVVDRRVRPGPAFEDMKSMLEMRVRQDVLKQKLEEWQAQQNVEIYEDKIKPAGMAGDTAEDTAEDKAGDKNAPETKQ